jgi:hypothetical protein
MMDYIITWLLVIAFVYIAFGKLFGLVFGMLSELYRWLLKKE